MKHLFLIAVLVLAGTLRAQTHADKYWIFFNEKCSEGVQLSPRALERRDKNGIRTDWRDIPVCSSYSSSVFSIAQQSGKVSRWLNACSAWLTPEEKSVVAALPFVKEIRPIAPVHIDYEVNSFLTRQFDPGYSGAQIRMLGLDSMHSAGFNGRGILISVMDNGFPAVDTNQYLSHLFESGRITAMRDFVDGDDDPRNGGSHGAMVLSIIAGFRDGVYTGSAPGASYILCRTENDASETHQEEDNWVAAMEFADSLGADIFTTSLGYSTGMGDTIVIGGDTISDYPYSMFDGNTAIITVAADIAASRGILVLNSAGNNGVGKLNAPADGDSVLAVGAVDSLRVIASFSSLGPTADGRLKPDLCAMGRATYYVSTSGLIGSGNGTSFSCPMLAGFAACLLQSAPATPSMVLYDEMLESGDRHVSPDTIYGHGIPSASKVYAALHNGESLASAMLNFTWGDDAVIVYPTVVTDEVHLYFNSVAGEANVYAAIYDVQGKLIAEKEMPAWFLGKEISFNRHSDLKNPSPGIYLVRTTINGDKKTSSASHIIIPE